MGEYFRMSLTWHLLTPFVLQFQNHRARKRKCGQPPVRKAKLSSFIQCNAPNSVTDIEAEVNDLIDKEIKRGSFVQIAVSRLVTMYASAVSACMHACA